METQKRFGVVGAGLVGTLFESVPEFEVVHRNEWEPVGVYNLASEAVHLPTFIKEKYGWEGDVVEPYSLGYCSTVVFDTNKAESVGLI